MVFAIGDPFALHVSGLTHSVFCDLMRSFVSLCKINKQRTNSRMYIQRSIRSRSNVRFGNGNRDRFRDFSSGKSPPSALRGPKIIELPVYFSILGFEEQETIEITY